MSNITEKMRTNYRAIRDAIDLGKVDEVRRQLSNDRELLLAETPFGSWLHVAAGEGKIEMVIMLLELGLDINTSGGPSGGNALNEAASEGKYDVAKLLIHHGAHMDVSDPVKNPLFGGIEQGDESVVQLLLESGIDASVRYTGKRMKDMGAVEFAEERGERKIAAMIREHLKNSKV